MSNPHVHIAELETELIRIKEELEKAREQAGELESVRKDMLSLLEDLNKSAAIIKRGEKEWETIVDAIADPIFIRDKDFRIIRANKAYAAASGMPFKEIIGKPYYTVFPKMEGPCKVCLNALGSPTPCEDDISVPTIGRSFNIKSFPIWGENGSFLYSVHFMEDITDQKRAEDALRASENKYRHLFDNLHDAAFLADAETGHIVDTNKKAEILLDRRREEIIGMHQSELHPPGKAGEYRRRFEEHLQKGPLADYEGEVIRGDGRVVPVAITASPMTINGRRLILVLFRDITEWWEMMERLEEEVEVNRALLDTAEAIRLIFDRDTMFKRVAEGVSTVVDAERCVIFLWEREQGGFLPAHVSGIVPPELRPFLMRQRLTRDMTIVEQILRGETVIIDDVMNSPLFPREVAETLAIRTMMGIPIRGTTGVLGFIDVERIGIPRPFGEKEEEFLKGVAHQVAVSLDNVRLYEEMRDQTIELTQRVEILRVMNEIDKSILSCSDTHEILETVTQMVASLIPCDRVTVGFVDKEREGFVYKAGFGTKFAKGMFIPFTDTSTAEVVRTGRSQYISDLSMEREPLRVERILMEEGYHSPVRLPLFVKGETIGVLSVGSRRVAAFHPDQVATLEKLAAQIAVALENARLVTDMKELFFGIVGALSAAIDAKSPWTAGHSHRVTQYSLTIAKAMGMGEKDLKDLELAGLLHDVGKIGTYDVILEKPGRLTEEELKIMRLHPLKGAEILGAMKHMKEIIPAIKHHHEFYNGEGYPGGLKGEAIPLMSRILAVADTVDAMGADRPYRTGRSKEEIIAELQRCSGSQFDPKVVEAFLHIKALPL
ncbi:MAG: GAF domain-containing protein [Nitrospirae bacterium]|nr:GAF domain-containing protein [Nitrospirota bacterium]